MSSSPITVQFFSRTLRLGALPELCLGAVPELCLVRGKCSVGGALSLAFSLASLMISSIVRPPVKYIDAYMYVSHPCDWLLNGVEINKLTNRFAATVCHER